MNDKDRKPGFYRVVVRELGPPFETIGLWVKWENVGGYWRFAEGDGDEQGAGWTVISVNEELILKDRNYDIH